MCEFLPPAGGVGNYWIQITDSGGGLCPQGIALTVGLVAVHHLDDTWAILEQFGRSTPFKKSLQNFSLKVSTQGS